MLFNPDEFEPLLRQAQKYAEQQEKAQRDREEESRKIREAHYKRFGSYYLGDFWINIRSQNLLKYSII